MAYGQMAGGPAGGYGGGAPGVSVDTILSEPHCRPGGVVAGKVHVVAGPQPAEIRHVTIALMPRTQNGYGGETAGPEVYRGALTRSFRLDPGQQRDLSFSIPLPYELPFTTVLGRELPGFTIGLCTEVDVKGAADPGDVDPISVEPLKSQQWVLAAIAQLGFKIKNVSFEQAKLLGVPQQLPFHQEIRLAPPPQYQGRFGEVGLSFVATPKHMAFVLEADRREGGGEDETFGRFRVEHPEAAETDWVGKIERWLGEAANRPRSQGSQGQGSQGSFHTPGAPPSAPGPGHRTPPGGAPLPPPGGGPSTFPPPPPGQHGTPGQGVPAPAAASYGGPGQPGQHGQPGQGQFPPPAPGPGQTPPPGAPPQPHGAPPPPPGPPGGHTPPPYPSPAPPYPGQTPPPQYPPPPGHGGPQYPPPPGQGPPQYQPGHGAPQYPPPPPGYPSQHGRPHQGHPGHGHPGHGHHGPGWGAAAAVGGVAAAGVAGGMAAAGAVDAFGNVVGGAGNVAGHVAGYAAGAPMNAFGNAAADAAGHVAGHAMNEAANAVASEAGNAIAGEAAGAVGEVLGGLLGGLFG